MHLFSRITYFKKKNCCLQVLKPLDVKTKFYNAEVTPKHCRKHVHYFAPQFFFGGGDKENTKFFQFS